MPRDDVIYFVAKSAVASMPIVPGDVEVSADVSMIYEIL